tara:strand:- start:1870 stop:2589 length:720 start_codon:yes stop_codon:yes gene_type:complete
MEVAPTAHYSMGGFRVNPFNPSTNIKGLFAAGEVAGGLHGANRLGGNSLAEILIFGKIVGENSSRYSRNLNFQMRSKKMIYLAIENIEKIIKRGSQKAITLQNQLSDIMWNYCGVIKDEKNLKEGLNKLNDLKGLSMEIDIKLEENNQQELIDTLNLQSSLISAEATIKSAFNRKESRGAHQRSDFKKLEEKYNFNNVVYLQNQKLKVKEINSIKLKSEILDFVSQRSKAVEERKKLLE